MKKLYLKTPEAVIKALKEGKDVRDENNNSFKIVDGLIVATYHDCFYIGYTIYGIDKPYILEEESFKIEVGKWYETRDHQKVRCFKVSSSKCFFTIDNRFSFLTSEGGYYNWNKKEDDLDIIGPWKENK